MRGRIEDGKRLNPLRPPSFPAAKFRYVNSGVIRSYGRVLECPQFVLTDFWSRKTESFAAPTVCVLTQTHQKVLCAGLRAAVVYLANCDDCETKRDRID